MTKAHYSVFEIADFGNSVPIGEIEVGDDGAIALRAGAGSPSEKRLVAAVDELRKTSSLGLRSESMRGDARVMEIHAIRPGEALYAAAVTDTLSSHFGFRCVRQAS